MDLPSLYLKSSDFDRACLPGVWLEPVVSHSYYSPGVSTMQNRLEYLSRYKSKGSFETIH